MDYSIIGIDFGTSATVVKVKNYAEGIPESHCESLVVNGSHTIPTLIFERNDSTLFFGQEAIREQNAGTEGVLYQNFKMDLIHSNPDRRDKAQKLVQEFFKFLYSEFSKQRAVLHVSQKTSTYVSYPAKWTPDIVRFMKECAIAAGFGTEANVFGETEPTAAIFSTFVNHSEEINENKIVVQERPINVMMLDMGAGTSDVTIFKFKVDKNNKFFVGYENQIITYPTVDNTYLCGGREIDKLLSEYVMNYVRNAVKPEYASLTSIIEKTVVEGSKDWKESSISPALSRNETSGKPGFLAPYSSMGAFNSGKVFDDIDRSRFELLVHEHQVQLYHLINEAIKKAKTVIHGLNGPEDIDLVILTGGHSQWYYTEDFFRGVQVIKELPALNFQKIKNNPKRLIHEARAQETVANGLVYRDLSFKVSHTFSNNIWCKISIDKQPSPLYHLVSSTEPLPISRTADKFEIKLLKDLGTTDYVHLRFDFYYGNDDNINNAVHKSYHKAFRIQGNWEAFVGGFFSLFLSDKETYTVTCTIVLNIKEDGTGTVEFRNATNWNSDENNSITITL
jgi:molecular chaperone DnaK (HSP70)